ncbi:MAG: MarR family transcriptional regulator [Sporolactobacillus sp.]
MKADHKPVPSEKKLNIGAELWHTLSQTVHLQMKARSRFLNKWGLSPAQYDSLVAIRNAGKLSQKALADALFVSKGNITQLIVRLERAGYVQREQEWKTKYVTLTDSGMALCREIDPDQKQFFFDQFQCLARKQQKQIIEGLKHCHKEWKCEAGDTLSN